MKKLRNWFKKLFWVRCKYCKEKKQWFFFTFECRIVESEDYIKGTHQICTDCARPYFDN